MDNILNSISNMEKEQLIELLKDRRVVLSVTAGVLSLYYLYKKLKQKKYKMPPGPMSLPIVGNMLQLINAEKRNLHFTKWQQKYGDIFTIYMGPKPMVVLSSPEAVREAFLVQGNAFAGRMQLHSFDVFTDGGKDIAFAQPTAVWKLQRQIAHSAIRKFATGKQLEDALDKTVDVIIEYLNQHKGKTIDVPELTLNLTYNFLATVAFGRQFKEDDVFIKNIKALFKQAFDVIGSGFVSDFIPWLKCFERKKYEVMAKFSKEFGELMKREFVEHRRTLDPDNPRDITDEILIHYEKIKNDKDVNPTLADLTDVYFYQILCDIFSAGTDTTRITLSMLIGNLAQFPETQRKLHRELDDVLGKSGRATLETKELLPYTNAVVHETLRMSDITPIGLPHTTTCDTHLREFVIPKDTVVCADMHGIHYSSKHYENPERFNPERWINEEGKFQYQPYIFIPFSMGPRVCLGESLARADIPLFTARIYQRFAFEPVENDFVLSKQELLMGTDVCPFQVKVVSRE